MKETSYFNDIIYGLEKVLYYERGQGSYFRATLVGADFIKPKKIEGDTVEEVIDKCIKVLIDGEVIKDAAYVKDENGVLFTFKIKGCTHIPVEAKLKESGVPPYVCSPINMILYKIAETLQLAVESVDMNVDENNGGCVVRVVVFAAD